MILSSLTPGVSVLAALHILFRLSFMGSLSTKPRALFALEGTISEFLTAAFLVINFLTTLLCYMWRLNGEPFYKGTYQPSWTEYLG
ncbi:hypothetical protein BKA63DRAFT_515518 [Paraphoma chrysanthemicola]|nr:hypothetical protein BKA63DRAFT_515518 [Paraphoma chrysanthemicola]